MVLDLRKVPIGGWVAGLGGVALVVFSLVLNWFAVEALVIGEDLSNLDPGRAEVESRNAFESFAYIDFILLAAAVAASFLPFALASSYRFRLPGGPASVVAALGLLAAVLIAFRLIDVPDLSWGEAKVSDFPPEAGADVIPKLGSWLGLIASLLITGGALQAIRSRG